MNNDIKIIEREVLAWPGVSAGPGRFGAVVFRYGRRELGHIHHDRVADLPVPKAFRDELLAFGRARPHRAGSRGYVSYPIRSPEDVSSIIEVLHMNYNRAKAAAARRAASLNQTEDGVTNEDG